MMNASFASMDPSFPTTMLLLGAGSGGSMLLNVFSVIIGVSLRVGNVSLFRPNSVWASIARTVCYCPTMPSTRVLTVTSRANRAALKRNPRAGMRMVAAYFIRELLAWRDEGAVWEGADC
jgi:hypothetical protein